jgi:hypothetical protein
MRILKLAEFANFYIELKGQSGTPLILTFVVRKSLQFAGCRSER